MTLLQSLYCEHLEELSILYSQRFWLIKKSRAGWRDAETTEQRMEAHIDALAIGEEKALAICVKQAREGDFGELFGAISVFCRLNHQTSVESVLLELDYDDEKRINAVTDALCYGWPKEWEQTLISWMFDQLPQIPGIIRIAAEIIAYRRLPAKKELLNFLTTTNAHEKKEIQSVIRAFNRLQFREGLELIINNQEEYDQDCVDAALTALIRSGNSNLINSIIGKISPEELPGFTAGLYGDQETQSQISNKTDKEHILSVGLLGLPGIIPQFIEHLADKEIAENVSIALDLITGADLQETLFIPDEIDEDMLFPDELEKHKKGELYPPGKEPGRKITRISQNPETWNRWWLENKKLFNPDLRYRCGKPYSPLVLAEIIDSNKYPNYIRQFASDELVIRYGINFPFETFMPVADQQRAINNLKNRLVKLEKLFEPGKWYRNGKEIDYNKLTSEKNLSGSETM